MKKILIILSGVLLVYSEPVLAKNEITGIVLAKKITKAKKVTKKSKKTKQSKKIAKKVQKKKKKYKRVRYNVGEMQSYAHQLVLSYGWTEEDYQALVLLWYRESSWNPYAVNGNACGIPQAKPCSKMAKFGRDYKTNWKVQVMWGLDYIKEVYTTPREAYRKFLRRKPHWY